MPVKCKVFIFSVGKADDVEQDSWRMDTKSWIKDPAGDGRAGIENSHGGRVQVPKVSFSS